MYFVVLLGKWDSDELVIYATHPNKVLMVTQDTYVMVYTHCKHEFTASKIERVLKEFKANPKLAKKMPDRAGGYYALSILRKTNGQYEGLSVTLEGLRDEAMLVKDDFIRIVGTADTAEAAEALSETGVDQTVAHVIAHAKKFNPDLVLQPHHFSPAIQKWLATQPPFK